jgi:putative cardiolipin synthase
VKQRLLLIALVTLTSACATPSFDAPKTESRAFTDTGGTRLGETDERLTAQHPGKSAFLLQNDGIDALATRILLSARAERSIDAQYYLISDDVTSFLFLDALLSAADRGIRVRLLLDDILTSGYDRGMAALNAHPNVEIRLFNPFFRRNWRILEGMTGFKRVNRRMHNKSFTVDNLITIIGGRNIGAEYFAAREDMNFGDLDVVGFGPVVRDVSRMFDRYWNDELALPVTAVIDPPEDPDSELEAFRERVGLAKDEIKTTPYAEALTQNIDDVIALDKHDFTWAPWELVYDDPEKARTDELADAAASIRTPLVESLQAAREALLIVSPYFVPNKKTIKGIQELIDRGIEITVVTNSLAATNHAVVHSGYGPSRKPLLKMGVEIWEVKPDSFVSGTNEAGVEGAIGALHTKGFVVDRKELFVGSFNWDPRSAYINTELGIIIESPEIAGVAVDRARARLPEVAYRVVLTEQGDLAWIESSGDTPVIYTKEPRTSWGRRFMVGVYGILPIKGQL